MGINESNLKQVRKAAVAGHFYPEDPEKLQLMIRQLLHQKPLLKKPPKAIIAPHAGFIYSGGVAALLYAQFLSVKDQIKRVVLLGPSHRVALRGIATSGKTIFETPLGQIPIDCESVQKILQLPQVGELEQAHEQEHSLEVQLPFLQEVLENFTLVPLVVGETAPEQISEVIEKLWGGAETLIVISSDLSHFHDYETAQKMDQRTSKAIEELSFDQITSEDACGRNPVKGLLYLARLKKITGKTIALCNSGDTAGDKNRVVGYGAYVFYE